jgi:hypothetical protein
VGRDAPTRSAGRTRLPTPVDAVIVALGEPPNTVGEAAPARGPDQRAGALQCDHAEGREQQTVRGGAGGVDGEFGGWSIDVTPFVRSTRPFLPRR